jgi:5-methylcytosine-specific restriction endonuclease McrA
VKGKFALSTSGYEGEFAGKKFAQLPPKVKSSINEFELHIVELTGDRWTDEVIRDIFQRLQKGTPLNPAEKRRALTGGVATVVAELAESRFFSECSQISDSRYGYEDAAAKILHLVFEGEAQGLKAAAIAKTYKTNKDLDAGDKRVQAIKRAMNYLAKSMPGIPYFKKYSALSVTTALVELMEKYSFKDREKDVGTLLAQIDERRQRNDKLNSQHADYDDDLARLTAAARSDRVDHLKWRKRFYVKMLLSLSLNPVDPERRFDKSVLSILLNKQGGKCAKCNCKITAKNSEVDHIHAHSRGGETEIDNAQLLCVKCNRSKGAK